MRNPQEIFKSSFDCSQTVIIDEMEILWKLC